MVLEVVKTCPECSLSLLDLTVCTCIVFVGFIIISKQGMCVSTKFIEDLEEIRQTRKLDVKYDLVLEQSDIGGDDEDFLNADPMVVLMEYMRQKNMRLVDLFTRLDADGSKSLSRQEFKDGLLVGL